jgi:hypothetical protein
MKKALLFLILCCLPGFYFSQYGGEGWNSISTLNGEADAEAFGYNSKISADGKKLIVGAPYNNSLRGYVKIYQSIDGAWSQLGQKIEGQQIGIGAGIGVDINADGSIVAVGEPWKDGGYVRVFQYDGSSWIQLGDNIAGSWRFGMAVSLSADGKSIAVNDGYADGSAKVYNYNGSSWQQIGQTIKDGGTADYFGTALELSDDATTLLVGAPQNTSNTGYAEIYKFENNEWKLKGNKLSGTINGSLYGQAVSISSDGNIIVIGAPNQNTSVNTSDRGHVFTYKYSSDSNSWQQTGETFEGSGVGEYFGYKLNLTPDGSKLVLGIYGANDWIGKAQVFEFKNNENKWKQLGGDVQGYPASYVYFGTSVSISADGKVLAAGAIPEGNTGNVYLFQQDDSLLSAYTTQKSNFSIYPNPTSDMLYIKSDKNIKFLSLYDLSGKLIFTTTNQQKISLESTRKGIYILQTTFSDKTIISNKIIKN